MLIDLKQYLKQ